jgi:hypothetical protein
LAVLFFSLVQGVAGTLKLFVLFANNKVRSHAASPIHALPLCDLVADPVIFYSQRFLRWHGRMGTLVFASAITAFLTGVSSILEGGTTHHQRAMMR